MVLRNAVALLADERTVLSLPTTWRSTTATTAGRSRSLTASAGASAYARRGGHRRARRPRALRQGAVRRDLGHACLACGPGRHARRGARADPVLRSANPLQPGPADRRARAAADGARARPRGHRLAPLGGGLLTGRYGSDRAAPKDGRKAGGISERDLAIADALNAVAEGRGASAGQVAIAWVRAQQRRAPTIPDRRRPNGGPAGRQPRSGRDRPRASRAAAPRRGQPRDARLPGRLRRREARPRRHVRAGR